MSKLTKLVSHPDLFLRDALLNRLNKYTPKNLDSHLVLGLNISKWKRAFFSKILKDEEIIYLENNASVEEIIQSIKQNRIKKVYLWGNALDLSLNQYLQQQKIALIRVEDGFLRSLGLGANFIPPYSLCFDTKGVYYDANQESQLEYLIKNFDKNSELKNLIEAAECINLIKEHSLSKYNFIATHHAAKIYGKKIKKRVLVIGQVEDDQSIQYGANQQYSNNDLVRLAVKENPDAEVFYKVHPDVLHGKRSYLSNPKDVQDICKIIDIEMTINDALTEVDHVYTITSLTGFEALLRGIKVTTLGAPFYSGWGLTDDRQMVDRRKGITRSIEEVFVCAYLLYPTYFDPKTGEKMTLRKVIRRLISDLAEQTQKTQKNNNNKVTAKKVEQNSMTASLAWLNTEDEVELSSASYYLYLPWIAEHGDFVIHAIKKQGVPIQKFALIKNSDSMDNRILVKNFAKNHPDQYRKIVLSRLIKVKDQVKGMLVTLDWIEPMSILIDACKELNIPTYLIPHESVFLKEDKYYFNARTGISYPRVDKIFAWGNLQKSIFTKRGFAENDIIVTGAPKFDPYYQYQPKVTRQQLNRLMGFKQDRKLISYAVQPLDSQLNMEQARKVQQQAIRDMILLAEKYHYNLIVRMPPSNDDVLDKATREQIQSSDFIFLEEKPVYLLDPYETIYHSDIVASVNSTMLFEAALNGKVALSTKYIEFEQIWDHINILVAENALELLALFEQDFCQWKISAESMQWAATEFSNGNFDGKAAMRIAEYLNSDHIAVEHFSTYEILLQQKHLDVVAIPSKATTLQETQSYLSTLLNANVIKNVDDLNELSKTSGVNIFFQWGFQDSKTKQRGRYLAKNFGKDVVYLEDGFLRSKGIGLSGEPALSIMWDDIRPYYCGLEPTRLEQVIERGDFLSATEQQRSRELIQKICNHRLSKYNHAPDVCLNIGHPERKKVLLLDQRKDDQSVIQSGADEMTFNKMLMDVISNYKDYDIIIKQHPDGVSGMKESYYSTQNLNFVKFMDNVYLVDFDINIHAIFDLVDEVFVVSSGAGFEALMANKTVHCYGLPFYSGWGLTIDQVQNSRRSRKASLEEVFYASYIMFSRYVNPHTESLGTIEDVIEYLKSN